MPIIHDQAFRAWEACAPPAARGEPAWRFHAFRIALYMHDLAARDARTLRARGAVDGDVDRLVRSVASIGAHAATGFARPAAEDRSRFLRIALRAVRESLCCYRALQAQLPYRLAELRYDQLSQLRRMLVGSQKWLAPWSGASPAKRSNRKRIRLAPPL